MIKQRNIRRWRRRKPQRSSSAPQRRVGRRLRSQVRLRSQSRKLWPLPNLNYHAAWHPTGPMAHSRDNESEIAMTAHSSREPEQHSSGLSAIYVDTENITPPSGTDDVEFVQGVIGHIVANWPDGYPPIGLLALYVPADKTSQWRTWASALLLEQQPSEPVKVDPSTWREPLPSKNQEGLRVRGVQHFSRNGSKNSADIAIVLDAFDDLLLSQRVDFVAVISNDSDFYALFDKFHEVIAERGHPVTKVPLLWIVAPNGNNLSPEVKRFLPSQFIWDMSDELSDRDCTLENNNQTKEFSRDILEALVSQMKRGQQYRASTLHDIVKKQFSTHELSDLDTAVFGHLLKASSLELSDLGVDVTSTSGTSRYTRK